MPSSFDAAREIERRSVEILEPLLERQSGGRFVFTDKGRLAKEIQAKYGDVLMQSLKEGGALKALELKAEREKTGNFFLELFSNGSRYKLGWMWSNEADLLLYHFLDADELYIIDMPRLKRWFWFGETWVCKNGVARRERGPVVTPGFSSYRCVPQRRFEQRNDTWGVLADIHAVRKWVGAAIIQPQGLFREAA